MICRQIEIKQFRNIDEATIRFTPEINVICGENAQGKTNALEAVCYFALGKSFRGIKDKDAVRFNQTTTALKMEYEDSIREQTIAMQWNTMGKRNIEHNGVRLRKITDIIGSFRAVLFCPEHLSLIQDGPQARRNFLDIAISQLRPLYLSSLQKYNKILKERNTLIKDAKENPEAFDKTIDIWSGQLAHEAAIIAQYRVSYLQKINEQIKICFGDMMNGKEIPSATYVGSAHLEQEAYFDVKNTEMSFYHLLTQNHEKEIGAGNTLWGIHKDDIEIRLNDKEARFFCSQGQQRSLALAMKLAEGEICKKDCGESPVFLFDDVLSELDNNRKNYLLEHIQDKQVIMTTCEPIEKKNVHYITVQNGQFTEST